MAFSESLSPIDRFVSIVIDEVALNPKMTFDRNGMLIGHAINDVTEDFTQEILANKMICYSVQGISSTFSKVCKLVYSKYNMMSFFQNYEKILTFSRLCHPTQL